jgi:hypothetical protein
MSVQYGASSVMSSNGMTIAVSTAASTDSYYKLTYMYRWGPEQCSVWQLLLVCKVCRQRMLAGHTRQGVCWLQQQCSSHTSTCNW